MEKAGHRGRGRHDPQCGHHRRHTRSGDRGQQIQVIVSSAIGPATLGHGLDHCRLRGGYRQRHDGHQAEK